MTMPSLPAQGNTNWRDWAAAVHDAATEVTEGRLAAIDADDITDATVTGKALVRSSDAAAARTAIGAASATITANTQTGTAYTLVLADSGKAVEMNNAAANTLTVPPNSSVAFPVGTVIEVMQLGAGQTTVAAGSGVTLRAPDGAKLAKQYASASLRKRATNEWVLAGNVTA